MPRSCKCLPLIGTHSFLNILMDKKKNAIFCTIKIYNIWQWHNRLVASSKPEVCGLSHFFNTLSAHFCAEMISAAAWQNHLECQFNFRFQIWWSLICPGMFRFWRSWKEALSLFNWSPIGSRDGVRTKQSFLPTVITSTATNCSLLQK